MEKGHFVEVSGLASVRVGVISLAVDFSACVKSFTSNGSTILDSKFMSDLLIKRVL